MIPRLKVHFRVGPEAVPVCGHPNAGLLTTNHLQVTCLSCRAIWRNRVQNRLAAERVWRDK